MAKRRGTYTKITPKRVRKSGKLAPKDFRELAKAKSASAVARAMGISERSARRIAAQVKAGALSAAEHRLNMRLNAKEAFRRLKELAGTGYVSVAKVLEYLKTHNSLPHAVHDKKPPSESQIERIMKTIPIYVSQRTRVALWTKRCMCKQHKKSIPKTCWCKGR